MRKISLKEQIGSTILGIALRLSPKTPKTPQNQKANFFPNQDNSENSVADLDILNTSFKLDDINEIITDNNDLRIFLAKVKSKFEMLLGECREIETKLNISSKENEELKMQIDDIKTKEVN